MKQWYETGMKRRTSPPSVLAGLLPLAAARRVAHGAALGLSPEMGKRLKEMVQHLKRGMPFEGCLAEGCCAIS